jgi:hypothetical protein
MELLSQLGVVIVALSSLLSLVVIPVFTAWRDRRRALLVSYQAGLTDAIHRELGARAAIGRRVLGVVLRALDRMPGRYAVVLTPRETGLAGQSSPPGGQRMRGGRPPNPRISGDEPLAWRLPVAEAAATRSRPTHGKGEGHGASIG